MKWPWVNRKWLKYRTDDYNTLLGAFVLLQRQFTQLEGDRDYFRAAYYDLRDIVAEQRAEIEHYKKLINGELGDSP